MQLQISSETALKNTKEKQSVLQEERAYKRWVQKVLRKKKGEKLKQETQPFHDKKRMLTNDENCMGTRNLTVLSRVEGKGSCQYNFFYAVIKHDRELRDFLDFGCFSKRSKVLKKSSLRSERTWSLNTDWMVRQELRKSFSHFRLVWESVWPFPF